jgi:hypothetical protein
MSNFTKLMIKAAAGNAGGGCPEEYWAVTASYSSYSASNNDTPKGIVVDSQCNIYAVSDSIEGIYYGGNTVPKHYCYVRKYDSEGTLLWTKEIYTPGSDGFNTYSTVATGIAIDSQDNIYVTGYANIPGYGGGLLVKMDTSGDVEWKKFINGLTIYSAPTVDSSGNVYIFGTAGIAGTLVKVNSSGSVLWGKSYAGPGNTLGYTVKLDSNGNIFIGGQTSVSGVGNRCFVVKLNDSGSIVWTKIIANGLMPYLAIDSQDNVYAMTYTSLYKLNNSTGAFQWTRNFLSYYHLYYGISIDAEDNIVLAGRTNQSTTGYYDVSINKLSPSGSIIFNKTFGSTADEVEKVWCALDGSYNIIVDAASRQTDNYYDLLTIKLPADGSGNGTYGPWVYKNGVCTTDSTNPSLLTGNFTASTYSASIFDSFTVASVTPDSSTFTAITP